MYILIGTKFVFLELYDLTHLHNYTLPLNLTFKLLVIENSIEQ